MGVVIWLLGVVLTLGAAVGPAEGSKRHHYDFFVSRPSIQLSFLGRFAINLSLFDTLPCMCIYFCKTYSDSDRYLHARND